MNPKLLLLLLCYVRESEGNDTCELLQLRADFFPGYSVQPQVFAESNEELSARFKTCEESCSAGRWEPERAQTWYQQHGWGVGANFIPSTAVNALEMWQNDTFDEVTIDRELGLAEGLGMSVMRVFLHDLVYTADGEGLLQRMDRFLEIAAKHNISTMFVLFDGCWKPDAHLGAQPAPLPHVHNSQWVQSPTNLELEGKGNWSNLKAYVKGVISHFRNDSRVHSWDLYNEVDNVGMERYMVKHFQDLKLASDYTIQLRHNLLCESFQWARAVLPEQPLHAGEWGGMTDKVRWLLRNISDIGNMHSYGTPNETNADMQKTKDFYPNRPVIMTEYMARPLNSTFDGILPVAYDHDIGAINWGLVRGKTNTVWSWESWKEEMEEPNPWFHDIFWPNGTAYDGQEITTIRKFTNS